MYACGIDIGGTKIAGGLVSERGEVVQRLELPTTASDVGSIVAAVIDLVEQLGSEGVISTVGVGAAALINRHRDRVFFAPNVAWSDFPLKAVLEEKLGRLVHLDNDANAAGWAEFQFGAARGASSMLMLTMGTGVGGAIIDDGRLLAGGFGSAGELGHIVIEPGGRLCGCGNHGCLEQYASGTALMREARERLENPGLSPEALAGLLAQGHEDALGALTVVSDAMGRGITSLVAVTDPDIVVIGGGLAAAGSLLTDLIEKSFATHYGPHARRPVPKIVAASLGNTAGVVGAADLARRSSEHNGA